MKTIVIKVGGAFLSESEIASGFLAELKKIISNARIVIVHGGGDIVEEHLSAMQLTSEKHNGLRVTPASQIPVVVGALAGTANKQLCAIAWSQQLNAVGLSLADGGTSNCEQLSPELGQVGQVVESNATFIELLLNNNYLPVISSIGCDKQGNLLNVNADQAATAIAKALDAELLLLSNVPGVLDQNKQCLNSLNASQIDDLIHQGVIKDGMIVKVNAALDAADIIGNPVTIASWQNPEALTSLVSENQGTSGTSIIPSTSQQEAS